MILWSGEITRMGHYTCISKIGDEWKLFNDRKVTVIGDDAYCSHILRNNIYGIPYTVISEQL